MTALWLMLLWINIEEWNLEITCMQILLLTIISAFKEKKKNQNAFIDKKTIPLILIPASHAFFLLTQIKIMN